MTYDFNLQIVDLNKKIINNPFLGQGDDLDASWLVIEACVSAILLPPQKKVETGEEKFENYNLACKMKACPETNVDLTVDEAAKVKKAVGRCYGSAVVGFIWKILDGE